MTTRRMHTRLLGASVLFVAFLVTACGPSPTEVFEQAQKFAKDKDLESFAGLLTERSAKLIKNLDALADETNDKLVYSKTLYNILPEGNVEDVDIKENRAVLIVARPKSSDKNKVILLKEDGAWRIEAFELPEFWKPLRNEGS